MGGGGGEHFFPSEKGNGKDRYLLFILDSYVV